MEARTITQVKVYKLILNHMGGYAENGEIVAVSDDYDKLVAWYHDQFAGACWRDGRFLKTFKEGSPLEWFNPADDLTLNSLGLFGHGISYEWVNEDVYYDIMSSGRCCFI